MSKNLTRKGLALGALVSLATSVFAYAPANAAGESAGILVAPNKGTTYNSIVGASFDLSTVLASSLSAKTELSYLVTNSAAAPIKLQYKGAADATVAQSVRTGASASSVGASADTSDANASYTAKAIVVTGTSLGTNNSVDETSSLKNHLIVTTSTDSTETVVLTVQAFLDANNDGLLNNLDAYAAPVTLTFLPAASVTATTTITTAAIGANKLQAKVALGNDINQANIPANTVFVQFKAGGNTVALTGPVNSTDATYDSTDAALKTNNSTLASGNIDSSVYVAQAYFGAALATKLGAASNATTTAASTNASIDGTDLLAVANTANVKYTKDSSDSRGVASEGAAKVRSAYAGAINFSTYVMSLDAGDTTVAGNILATAGLPVRVTLTATNLTGANTFTAGGKTISATTTSAYFDTVTDADGKVAFTGSSSLGTKLDSVTVSVAVLDGSAYASADAIVLTWNDAVVQNPVLTSGIIGNGSASTLKIAKGGSYTLNYSLKDDFGQLVTATDYRLNVAYTTLGNTAAVNAAAPVTAGKASITIVDDSATTASSYSVTATLQKLNTAGTAWANSTVATGTAVVNVYVSTQVAATVTAVVPTASQSTITKSLVNADLRVDGHTQSAATIGYSGTTITVSGVVTDASGVAVAGQDVTIAGANLGFISDDTLVYKVGSITVQTDSTGNYEVAVFSTTAGKASVTVTAGAATATKTITFSGVTLQASTNVLTIDAAALSQVGRSVTVTVKIVDKFGNAVSGITPTVAVTGVGSITTAAATDATGLSKVQFVAGANDFGDAVITAKYTASDDVVVSASKTVTVGITDAQIDVVGKRVTAVASFSKGKTVAFYVNGEKKWSKLSASDADVVLNYNLKKGRNTVTVKISGGFVTTEVIVVK